MADVDSRLQSYLNSYVIPITMILAAIYALRGYLSKIRLFIIAYFINKAGHFSNKHYFHNCKKDLFYSLKKLRETVGEDLKILEIGAGGGANFEFYPSGSNVLCLDPNPCMEHFQKKNSKQNKLINYMGFVKGFAENMEFENHTFDVVVSTLTFCSVRDPMMCLKEVQRVLKHNGKFYFLDHVSASKWGVVYFMQRIVNPLWKRMTGGCHVTRFTGEYVKKAGFKDVDLRYFNAGSYFFYVINPCCMGIATNS